MFKIIAIGVLLALIFAPSIYHGIEMIRNPEEYDEETGIGILRLFIQPIVTYDKIIGEQTDILFDDDPFNNGGAKMLIFACSVLMLTVFATISYMIYAIFSILRLPFKILLSYLASLVSMVWLTDGLQGTYKFFKLTLQDAGINPIIPFSFGIVVSSIVIFLSAIFLVKKIRRKK